jgi:hypothetical protein
VNPRSQFAGILCGALDEAGLPWAITHGAEGYPDKVGRDFDILLPARYHDEAVNLVKETAAGLGWDSCLLPLRWAGAPIFLWKLDRDTLYFFEMHFIDRIDWSGCILADGSEPHSASVKVNGLSIATWSSFAKRILTQILAGCWHRIEDRPDDFLIQPNEDPYLEDSMACLFGRETGKRLLEFIRKGDFDEVKRLAPRYRINLILRALLPGTGVRISTSWFTGKFARTLGVSPWLPPCLFVIGDQSSIDSIDGLLAQVTPHLGFGKCHILRQPPDKTSVPEWWKRWQIHVNRSLFHLVVVPLEPTMDGFAKVKARLGHQAVATGVWVAVDHSKADGLKGIFEIPADASYVTVSHPSKFGVEVAYAYIRQLKRISERG